MKIEKQVRHLLDLNGNELNVIVRCIMNHISGWATKEIELYKDRMEDSSGPQHYITGFEQYNSFMNSHSICDCVKLLDELTGKWQWDAANRDKPMWDWAEAKRMWMKQFLEIQHAYDKNPKGSPMRG